MRQVYQWIGLLRYPVFEQELECHTRWSPCSMLAQHHDPWLLATLHTWGVTHPVPIALLVYCQTSDLLLHGDLQERCYEDHKVHTQSYMILVGAEQRIADNCTARPLLVVVAADILN